MNFELEEIYGFFDFKVGTHSVTGHFRKCQSVVQIKNKNINGKTKILLNIYLDCYLVEKW